MTQNQNPVTSDTPLHHFMVCAEILYKVDSDVSAVNINAVIYNEKDQTVNVPMLNRAQQMVQAHFHQGRGDTSAEILNVTLINICYLGLMTPDEFHGKPSTTTEANAG